ncbi:MULTISPECIES: hypothetical protein [unclassified Bacillus (in: firmicutes)]
MKLDANGKFSLDLNYEDVLNQELTDLKEEQYRHTKI